MPKPPKTMTVQRVAEQWLQNLIDKGEEPPGTHIVQVGVIEEQQRGKVWLSNGGTFEFQWRTPDQPKFGDEH